MKTYLVGGAVRDGLLKLPVKDKDWVVVGATPDMMLEQGYQQVGRDFRCFFTLKAVKSTRWRARSANRAAAIPALSPVYAGRDA